MDEEPVESDAEKISYFLGVLDRLEDYRSLPNEVRELLRNPPEELFTRLEDQFREDIKAGEYRNCITEVAVALFIREKRYSTLPLIIQWMSVDEETENALFGDLLTENGAEILAGLGAEHPEAIKAMADRRDISHFAYGVAMHALVYLWATGVVPLAQMNEWINGWLDEVLIKRDQEVGTAVADALCHLPVTRFLPKVEFLCELELINPMFSGYEEFQEQARSESDARYKSQLLEDFVAKTDFESWIKAILERHQPVPTRNKPLISMVHPSQLPLSRNDRVRIEKDGVTADMKYKKAEVMLQVGWKIVKRLP